MYQVMDDLINNFSTFLLGTVNEPYKVVSKYEHNIYSRSLDTKPDQYMHPGKFLSKSGIWIKGHVSLSSVSPLDDSVLVILGHDVAQSQKYNNPFVSFLNNRGFHVGGIDQPGCGESEGLVYNVKT